MRHPISTLLIVPCSFLLYLAGCATDSTKSSRHVADGKSTSVVAQTQEAQPPSGEIQERSVIAPSATTAPPPRITQPGARYVGPTDNITKVANAIQVFTKGLTSLVRVAPSLPLTQPVTISVGFYSRCSGNRVTQVYLVGNNSPLNLFDQDAECDGKPREMDIDIEFTEPKPGGGAYAYALPVSKPILDPLYDVAIGPGTFTLLSKCGLTGPDQIHFQWSSPDHQWHSVPLLMSSGQQQLLNDFAWFGNKVSASSNLNLPFEWFYYVRPLGLYNPVAPAPTNPPNLVPGVTHHVEDSLPEAGGSCKAALDYNITYQVHRFSLLELTGQPF